MEQVLKQFTIAFGLDNTELKQGLKDSQNALSGFVDTARNLLGAWASFEFFKTAISNFQALTTELSNAQTLTGESATNIQALGGALKRFGGDTTSAVNAIKAINQHLHDAKFGEGALMDIAKKYGLVISKGATAEQTILNLAKQMGRYDRQTRVAIASQLGLDEAMQLAFADGGKELEQLIQKQKRLNIVSPEDSKIAQAFNYALLDLQDVFGALMRDFARVILPAFSKLLGIMTDFIDFLRRHKIFVVAFFAGILIALTPILLTLGKMAIASTIAFAPFYAIGAVIAAVALIFEDLLYYFQGYESVTGKLVKQFPLLEAFIEPLRPIVLSIFEVFKSIYNLLKEPSWDNLSKVFKTAGEAVYNLLELPLKGIKALVDGLIERFPILGVVLKPVQVIVDTIYNAFKAIGDLIKSFSFDNLLGGLKDVKDSVGGFLGKLNPLNLFGKNKTPEVEIKPLVTQTQAIPETPAAPMQSSLINNSAQNVNNNNYNVTNNINQNISSATPKQLADNSNKIFIDSINQQRQQKGAL